MTEPRRSFEELLERSRAEYEAWRHPEVPRIDLAWDTSSLAAGCEATREALLRVIDERGSAVEVGRTAGYGLQWLQPLAEITWRDGTTVLYGPVTPESVGMLVDEATGRVGAAAELAIGVLSGERPGIPAIERHPFLANERGRRLLANVGRIDPRADLPLHRARRATSRRTACSIATRSPGRFASWSRTPGSPAGAALSSRRG